MAAPIDRLFITGVSPITMDDVVQMVEYYRSNGLVNHPTDYLPDIIEQGKISGELVKWFPLEALANTNNFVSLLFYCGLSTINGVAATDLGIAIPNETVRRLFYDYIKEERQG